MGKAQNKRDSGHGYWMYADGTSRWGTGTYRNDEAPVLITEALHNAKDKVIERTEGMKDEDYNKAVNDGKALSKKLAFYAEATKTAKEKQKEKDEAEKAELAEKTGKKK